VLRAQGVRGRVVEEDTGQPVAGAFVVLVDSTGAPLVRALTGPEGLWRLRAPGPGLWRLRVDRIGYETVESDPIRVEAGEVAEWRPAVPAHPIRLPEVGVRDRRRCDMLPDEGLELQRAWDEARKALAATAWTGARPYYRFDAVLFTRMLDREGELIGEPRYEEVRYFGRHPFRAAGARDLVLGGFVRGGPNDPMRWFYGPDAEVLLSTEFLSRHCFRMVAGDEETADLVGLAFRPVEEARLPDISGVLWLDPVTSELRDLEYAYENLEMDVPSDALGGEVRFARLPSGAWIVRRWSIRTPIFGWREIRRPGASRGAARRVLEAIQEGGGHVTAVWRTARLASAVSPDTLPVRAPSDSLIVRFPLDEGAGPP
jgi:hypothetical protein